MFRHVVMFEWTDEATEDDVASMAAGLSELPDRISEIRAYHHGPDAGVNEGNFRYVVVADFDAVEDYLVYRDHPFHQQLIVDRIRPIVRTRAAVQYEVAGVTDASPAALGDPAAVRAALDGLDYLADDGLATSIFLALHMKRPLLLEGEPGTGKTEVAKVLAELTGGELIRLQCFEGIDVAQAVYEWDYPRQLLHLRTIEANRETADEGELYAERFLLSRPLLSAIAVHATDGPPPVLLIDEIDRADDEFEAFLLEVLSDWSITIPELRTFRAEVPPVVIITSNRTRDVHDALKRRCLYHWVEHPGRDREVAIVLRRVPGVPPPLAGALADATARLRAMGLYKPPGVAETIDWAEALSVLGRDELDEEAVARTLGAVLKYREDQERVLAEGLAGVVADGEPGRS